MADTDIFWDIRWYTVEQRRKRINSSALTRSSHWRAATKPRAICAARNWINSTDTSFSFSLSAKFSASYDRGNISTDRVCDHISYFIYIYIYLSLFYFRGSTRRVLFPYFLSIGREIVVPILCLARGTGHSRLNTKFWKRNYGKITELLKNIFQEFLLRGRREIFSSNLFKFSLQLDKPQE